jgi:hypothetical protein
MVQSNDGHEAEDVSLKWARPAALKRLWRAKRATFSKSNTYYHSA